MNSRIMAFGSEIWHNSAVPVWLERFALVVLAAAFSGIVVFNVLKMNGIQRTGIGIAILGATIYIAQTIHIFNQSKAVTPTSPPVSAPPTAPAETAKPPLKDTKKSASQLSAPVERPVQDIHRPQQETIPTIDFLVVETRLTYILKEGARIPEAERYIQFFDKVGISFQGPQGEDFLPFVGPINFHRQDDKHITAINRFPLPNGSQMKGKPIDYLRSLTMLRVTCPIGPMQDVERLTFLEVLISINKTDAWYYSEAIDIVPVSGSGASPTFGLMGPVLQDFKGKLGKYE